MQMAIERKVENHAIHARLSSGKNVATSVSKMSRWMVKYFGHMPIFNMMRNPLHSLLPHASQVLGCCDDRNGTWLHAFISRIRIGGCVNPFLINRITRAHRVAVSKLEFGRLECKISPARSLHPIRQVIYK